MRLLQSVLLSFTWVSIGCAPATVQRELNVDQSISALAMNVSLLKLLDENDVRGTRYLIEHNVNHNIFYLTRFRRAELTQLQMKALAQAIEYRKHHPFNRADYGHESISEDEEVNEIAK